MKINKISRLIYGWLQHGKCGFVAENGKEREKKRKGFEGRERLPV